MQKACINQLLTSYIELKSGEAKSAKTIIPFQQISMAFYTTYVHYILIYTELVQFTIFYFMLASNFLY